MLVVGEMGIGVGLAEVEAGRKAFLSFELYFGLRVEGLEV